MFERQDFEALMFGTFTANGTAFYFVKQGAPMGEAILGGVAYGSFAIAAAYGLPILARLAPTVGEPLLEFRRMLDDSITERGPVILAPMPKPGAPLGTIAADVTGENRIAGWRVNLRRFLLAGRFAASFSIRALTGGGYVTDTAYRTLQGTLVDLGILVSGKGGTAYAPGWDYGRATFHLKHEFLDLPGGEAPTVNLGK